MSPFKKEKSLTMLALFGFLGTASFAQGNSNLRSNTSLSAPGRRLDSDTCYNQVDGLDKCCIHTGCNEATYCDENCCNDHGGCYPNGDSVAGWYCTDSQEMDSNTPLDPCYIETGACQNGIAWDGSKWTCSDGGGGDEGGSQE